MGRQGFAPCLLIGRVKFKCMRNGKVISFVRTIVLTVGMLLTCSAEVNSVGAVPTDRTRVTSEVKVEAKATVKKVKQLHTVKLSKDTTQVQRGKHFCGFHVYADADTSVSQRLKAALETYEGPKSKVSSLKRHKRNKSDHNHGNAADFEFSDDMINYLVSENGKAWLKAHGLYFYIEAKPWSEKLSKKQKRGYKRAAAYLANPATAKHVFFNPGATGPHIHLGVE